jgi:hypothetical protein
MKLLRNIIYETLLKFNGYDFMRLYRKKKIAGQQPLAHGRRGLRPRLRDFSWSKRVIASPEGGSRPAQRR